MKTPALIAFQGARGAFSEEAARKLLGPKVDMPGIGAYAFFADPNGNRIGVYMAFPHEH